MESKKPASRGAQGGDKPGHKAAAGDAWRKENDRLRNGKSAEVRCHISDHGSEPPGGRVRGAEAHVNAAPIDYSEGSLAVEVAA